MSWLEGRGTGFRVPPYLRYDGQVKNLHIDAKMTGEMIADLLRAKEHSGALSLVQIHQNTLIE